MVERIWRDLLFGLRGHARTPIATAAIVATLSAGIAATAASFSIANAFFVRPLPIADPGRAVRIYQFQEGSSAQYFPVGKDELRFIRDLRHVFADVVIEQPRPFIIGLTGSYERIWGEAVSDRYFAVLGITPALGRLFASGDGERDTGIVVLGDAMWTRRFGRDPEVLGRELRIDGRLHRIVGIAPPSFRGTLLSFTSEVWIPGAPEPDDGFALGRLRLGVTIPQAREALDSLARRLERDFPAANAGVRFAAFRETDGRVPPPFHESALGFSALLMVAALLVTAIACANVAAVLLARAAARRGEIGVRLALGASRGCIVGQLLAEAVPLAVAAGVLGLALAWIATSTLSGVTVPIARGAQLSLDVGIDGLVLAVSLVATVTTGILFGLAPALEGSRASLVTTLRSSPRGSGSHSGRLGRLLLGAQVAVSVLLLAGGGFFVQSLRNAATVDLGFDPSNVVMTSADVRVRADDAGRTRQFWMSLIDRIRRLPRTESASLTTRLPLELGIVMRSLAPEGFQPREGAGWPSVEVATVDSDYFETLRIPILGGRDFDERDTAASSRVAIVNDVVARQFWNGGSAIGRTLVDEEGTRWEVVGIVRRSKYLSVGEDPKPYVYFAARQGDPPAMTIVARSRGESAGHLRDIAAAVRDLDPEVPLYEAGMVSERVDVAVGPTRGAAATLGVVSLVALALTSLGLFGAVAQAVSRRIYEIGVRRALGASDRSVAWLVIGETVTAAVVGLACGLAIAVPGAHLVRALLYDVSVVDPLVLGSASLTLVLVCLAAASPPALRAVRLNPAVALRHE